MKMVGVGVSTENELVMICLDCEKIVAVFDNWPDKSVTECECEACQAHTYTVPPKEELN